MTNANDLPVFVRETWRPVPDFEGRYEVSNIGHVRSLTFKGAKLKEPRLLKTCLSKTGYERLSLHDASGKMKNFFMHTLVLNAFCGKRPKDGQCAHDDGNRANNRIENLRWATAKENTNDKFRHGTMVMGEASTYALMRETQIKEIRRKYIRATRSNARELAAEYKISRTAVNAIVNRRTWKHI